MSNTSNNKNVALIEYDIIYDIINVNLDIANLKTLKKVFFRDNCDHAKVKPIQR